MVGHGLHWGVSDAIYPEAAASKDTSVIYADEVKTAISRVHSLSLVAVNSCNWAVVGERLFDVGDFNKTFKEITSKLQRDGHVIIALPTLQQPKHVSFFSYAKLEELLKANGKWVIKDYQNQFGTILVIAKYLGPGHRVDYLPVKQKKRACIIRYGAIGDLIMATPLIRALADDGYEVTLNISTYSRDAITNNPHVHNIIWHERNIVENHELGPYWDVWKTEYDKYINLSESVEGSLLKIEARRDFYTTQAFREATCSANYLDRTMEIGGYRTSSIRQEIYLSPKEQREAEKRLVAHKEKFVVAWGLSGSSFAHKRYGILEPVLRSWLDLHPDAHVLTLGNDASRILEFDHPQVTKLAGETNLREVFAMLPQVQCVAGPESAIINAAACFDTPKIVLLSHSSEANLCTHWTNYQALKPSFDLAPCYPCHQLHNGPDTCPNIRVEVDGLPESLKTGPCCAMGAISGDAVHAALDRVYNAWKSRML